MVSILDNVKIYGSRFTCNIVRQELITYKKNTSNLIEIKENKSIDFGIE